MAFLIRWWRAVFRALSLRKDRDAGWVEPANFITQAVLSGQPLWLPAFDPAADLPKVALPAAVIEEDTVEPELPVAPEVEQVAAEVDEPAAVIEEADVAIEPQRHTAPATRTRRRRGRRAA